jgi:hypothetical protein
LALKEFNYRGMGGVRGKSWSCGSELCARNDCRKNRKSKIHHDDRFPIACLEEEFAP